LKKLKTPWVAIIGIVVASMVFLYMEDLTTVANLANITTLVVFIVVNASVIYYRYKKPLNEGFRVPISIGKFPVIPFMGLVVSLFMITRVSTIVLLLCMFLIGLGIVVNFIWKVKQQ
jgi:APA family basic amino acid/polyamine antiporter